MRIPWFTSLAKGVYHYLKSEDSTSVELSVSETSLADEDLPIVIEKDDDDELPILVLDEGSSIFDDSDDDLVFIDETPTVELPFGIEVDEEFPFVYPFDTDFILTDDN